MPRILCLLCMKPYGERGPGEDQGGGQQLKARIASRRGKASISSTSPRSWLHSLGVKASPWEFNPGLGATAELRLLQSPERLLQVTDQALGLRAAWGLGCRGGPQGSGLLEGLNQNLQAWFFVLNAFFSSHLPRGLRVWGFRVSGLGEG